MVRTFLLRTFFLFAHCGVKYFLPFTKPQEVCYFFYFVVASALNFYLLEILFFVAFSFFFLAELLWEILLGTIRVFCCWLTKVDYFDNVLQNSKICDPHAPRFVFSFVGCFKFTWYVNMLCINLKLFAFLLLLLARVFSLSCHTFHFCQMCHTKAARRDQ